MDERIRFVIRHKDGECFAARCREFGISRKTGYKILERYDECGYDVLTDRSRRPIRYGNQLREQLEAAIFAAKKEKPSWGARKIRERLIRKLPHERRDINPLRFELERLVEFRAPLLDRTDATIEFAEENVSENIFDHDELARINSWELEDD